VATYYVDPVSGDDANAGTSVGAAWATIQKAIDTIADGDEVGLMNTGSHSLTATLDYTINGSADVRAPQRYFGCDASGNLLTSGFVVIDGSGIGGFAQPMIDMSLNNGALMLERVRLTGGTSDGIYDSAGSFTRLRHCRIDNCAGSGVYSTAGFTHIFAVDCEFDNNGGSGLRMSTSTRLRPHLFGCRVHHNAEWGVNCGASPAILYLCEIYRNTFSGIRFNGVADGMVILGCTIAYNSTSGIILNVNLADRNQVIGNTFVGNGAYGVDLSGNDPDAVQLADLLAFNHYHGNTSGELDTGSSNELGKQTGDPLFADTADGSEDFTPQSGSPLLGNGLNGQDIGAIGVAGGGGGGFANRVGVQPVAAGVAG
jgi:hypothetical protein